MPMNRDDDRRAAAGGVDAFQQLVDAFGSVSSRWPAKRREEAEVLLRSNTPAGAAARGILAEARALDRVLASPMPINPARVASLANRIVASSRQSPRASNVVPLTSAMGKGSPALGARSRVPRTGWAAGALLAASLLLGISIGPAITTMPAFHDVADFVGLSHIGDQLALTGAEDGSLHDEDVL
jgi:hypothetical protein